MKVKSLGQISCRQTDCMYAPVYQTIQILQYDSLILSILPPSPKNVSMNDLKIEYPCQEISIKIPNTNTSIWMNHQKDTKHK